jgi:hypothetical protein
MIVSYEISHPELSIQKRVIQSTEITNAATKIMEEYYHGIFQCDIRYQVCTTIVLLPTQ